MRQNDLSLRFFGIRPTALGGALLFLAVGTANCEVPGDVTSTSYVSDTTETKGVLTGKYDWLQFFGDSGHSGNNTAESLLTSSTVSALTQRFQVTVPTDVTGATYAEGSPVILTGVNAGGAVRDLAFLQTRKGSLLAYDANTGALVWSKLHPDINPNNTFTNSAPVLDPGRSYVYSYGLDGSVHKHAVIDGTETMTGGWPAVTTTKPSQEKGITSLTTATDKSGHTYLYVGHSGYGDGTDAQGHVTAIDLASGAQTVFNAMCSNVTSHLGTNGCAQHLGSIWGRAPMVYSSATDRIYGATGNGLYDPTNHFWGDTVLSLHSNATGNGAGNPYDTYTPSVQGTLSSQDLDLGSASVAIFPVGSTKYPDIGVQAGKDNTVRLINLDNLSNSTVGPGHLGGELWSLSLDSAHAQKATVSNSMPLWTNPADGTTWVFISVEYAVYAFRLLFDGSGNPSLGAMWSVPGLVYPGGSLLVANNVLYWAYSPTQTGSGNVKALNPTTGATLWTSPAVGGIHWQSPVVANGVLYITDNAGRLTAFALPAQSGGALPRTGWTATVGANTDGEAPANMIDGNIGTRWASGTAQANSGNQWIRIDMAAIQTFNKVTLDAAGSAGDYPRGYQLSVSADGTNFTTVATGAGTSGLTTITFPTQSARYFKVLQTGTVSPNWWSVYEVNVYSAAASLTAYPTTGWTASSNYPSAGGDVAANVIDGSTATRWSDGFAQSSTTFANGVPYIQVSMNASQPFSQIKLDSASSSGDYLRDFQVLAGNTNPPTTQIASGTATASPTTITFPSVTAQYIRVVQTTPAAGIGSWWSVAEFSVSH